MKKRSLLVFYLLSQSLGFSQTSVEQRAGRSSEEAETEAQRVLLNQCDDPESPLALVSAYLHPGDDCRVAGQSEDVQIKLKEQLKNKRSEFRLLTEKDFADESALLPEHGETPETNWIFRVRMPALTDHIYFAIVPKDSAEAAYIYGFN